MTTYTLELYIRYFLIFFPTYISTFCIFSKSLSLKFKKIHMLLILATLTVLTIINSYISIFNSTYSRIFYILCVCLFLYYLSKIRFQNSLIISIISIGISYSVKIVSVFIISFVGIPLNLDVNNTLSGLLVLILYITFSICIMHIKRFRKGISYFKDYNNTGFGLMLTSFIVVFFCIGTQEKYFSDTVITILLIGATIFAIGLFLWIRKSITEHYRKKLQDKADEHYRAVLAEKEEYIEQLNSSIAYLSKVVHRDNHLMSSLQYSIEQFKNCDNETEKQKILDEILTLTNERRDLLIKEQKSNKLLASTGSAIIDGALANLYVKASAHNIDFNLIVNDEVHYLINNIITQTDLETLLCDHIKDAVIAIESVENIDGKILVKIGMVNNVYEISIKDNGIDFDINTLSKLGLERVTTHKETGGSGIGFMTTFETLAKTKGSLIISEFENNIPFSKSITFRFDGLNDFIIKSYRSNEIKEIINRGDVTVI